MIVDRICWKLCDPLIPVATESLEQNVMVFYAEALPVEIKVPAMEDPRSLLFIYVFHFDAARIVFVLVRRGVHNGIGLEKSPNGVEADQARSGYTAQLIIDGPEVLFDKLQKKLTL
jgi:hypothetical protein